MSNLKTTYRDLVEPIPVSSREGYDWAAFVELIPALAAMEGALGDVVYHAEGSVGVHTRMCLDAMMVDPLFEAGSADDRFVLFMAMLLHDVSKPDTEVVDPVTGRVGNPGHSKRGAVDARILLWKAGVPFDLRERICRLVEVHQVPFHAFASRKGVDPVRLVRQLSWELSIPDLVSVARCDMIGREYIGKAECLQDIQLFEQLAQEEGCWEGPCAFADDHTRTAYFRGAQLAPEFALFKEPGSLVTVMAGLPASGKDTWVKVNRPGMPVVSFDDAKAELGLKHGENDGMAAHHAVDKAKGFLRKHEPFVWNSTHLSRQMRDKTLDLLWNYGARAEMVYLEQPHEVIMRRNDKRDSTLSNAGIERMLHRWELPKVTEVHTLTVDATVPSPVRPRARGERERD